MKRIISLTFFVLIYNLGFSQVWTQITQASAFYPGGGGRSTTAFSISALGKGYVVCGNSGNHSTFAYDTLLDNWTQCLDFPGGEDGTAVGFAIDTVGYVGAGVSTGCGIFNAFYKYYPVANQWVQLLNVPGPARGYAVGFVLGGKGYIGGGITPSCGTIEGLNDFYSYDPVANKWDTIATCPEVGCNHLAVGFSVDNYGYIGTGDSIANNSAFPVKGFYRYDPSSNKWTKMPDFPGGVRGGSSGFATCSKGYIGLGFSDRNQQVCPNDFYEFDPVKNTWKQIANFGNAGRQVASSFVINHSCFVALGVSANGDTQHDIWEYIQTVTPAFTTGTSSLPNICAGQSVSFTDTSNYAPTNWQWIFPGGKPYTSSAQNQVVEYDTAGTYDVILSAWNGCDSATQTFSQYVTVNNSGTLTVTANPSFICSGQSSTLAVASGFGIYMWSPANGLSDSTSASIMVSPAVSTTYSVSAAGGSCAPSGKVIVTVGDNTIGGLVTAARDTICQNTPGNLSLLDNSSNTIQWQSSIDSINFTNETGDTSVKYKTQPLLQTTWYRAIVGAGNCSAVSDTLRLYVPPALTASFYYTQVGSSQLIFNSDSSVGNIRSYHWDFGDGQTSNDSNPSHIYSKDSTYYVCLTLYDGSNCSYTFCRYSSITDGIPAISATGNWVVCPDPFTNQITLSTTKTSSQIQSVEMYDMLGRVVIDKNLSNAIQTSLQLDVSSLAKGMYFVIIRTTDEDYVQKVVKQ